MRETALQTPRSVQKEGEEVLQVLEPGSKVLLRFSFISHFPTLI